MAGAEIECPHCHAKTKLVAAAETKTAPPVRRIRKRVLVPLIFGLAVCAVALVLLMAPHPFTVLDFKFERATTNSSGTVSGVVQNNSSRARRHVRVEIDLLNGRGEKLWQTTAHTPEISPRGTWTFRALVVDNAVITGRVARVRSE